MPIKKRWSTATPTNLDKVPEKPGVYELHSFGELVYIGQAKNLRRRLGTHFRERSPNKFRFEQKTGGWLFGTSIQKMEDDHLTSFTNRHGGLPKWNKNDTRQ